MASEVGITITEPGRIGHFTVAVTISGVDTIA